MSSEGKRWEGLYSVSGLDQAVSSALQDLIQDRASLVSGVGVERRVLLFDKGFYDASGQFEGLCFGDIIELNIKFTYIDSSGNPRATPGKIKYWVVLGNTCDVTRSIQTLIVPLEVITDDVANGAMLHEQRSYKFYRSFYLPSWPGDVSNGHYRVNFCQIVNVNVQFLQTQQSNIVARLSNKGFVLLNICLVRFLARDDGRNDP